MSKSCQPTNDDLERWNRLATTTKLTHDPPISDPVIAHIRELENAVEILVADVRSRQKEDRKRRDDRRRYRDAISLGSGTEVVSDPPAITVLGRSEYQPDTYVRVRIVQHVTLTAELGSVWSPKKVSEEPSWTCGICGAVPPLPTDAPSLEYLLHYNSGDRLHFPTRENHEPSGDQYPVAGWTQRRDLAHNLICPTCTTEIDKALKKVVAKRRDTGTAEKT